METIKKHLTLYLITIAIVLAALLNYESHRARTYKMSANTLEKTLSNLNQEVKISTIKMNESLSLKQAEVENLEITNKNLQTLYDELLKASNTKAKDVKTLVNIGTITTGKDTVLCLVDSFGGLRANWVDQYINIKVDIDSARKAAIDYSIKDSLSVINYEKKHSILFGLIKWKSYEGCKVITHNPKSTPVTAVSYSIIK